MDVTSMLNGDFAGGKEELNELLTTTPPRNRTPWDAGGYSLPIIQQRKPITVDSIIHFNDSPRDSPVELFSRHSLSNSRTSLSSFASATTSGSHSRFSSTSTLSGFHTLPSNKAEPFTAQEDSSHRDNTHFRPPFPTSPSTTTTTPQTIAGSPHASFINLLRRVADGQAQEYQEKKLGLQGQMVITKSPHKDSAEEKYGSPVSLRRPASPSDAILIRRSGPVITRSLPDVYGLAIRTSLHGDRSSDQPQMQETSSNDFLPARFSSATKSHKRATSAPAFRALLKPSFRHEAQDATILGPKAEPTPSLSPDIMLQLSSPIVQHTRPSTPPQDSQSLSEQQPKCMFSQDCDTGSPPRKAISHIFGRNKMCTRLIPQQVWVHLCRKHYQRSRYRNLTLFANNTQCDLVQRQVQNLEEWSEENKLAGEGGVVKDWELAVRKREQKRLDDLASARNSGSTEDLAVNFCSSTPSTAPPDWLRELCGTGYKTSEIREILTRLQQDMMAGIVPVFPDIEILPNIVIDKEDPKSPKGQAKRKAVHGGHQRSKSLGNALRSDHLRAERRLSQLWLPSSMHSKSSHCDDSPQSRKRKTYEERDEDDSSRSPPLSQNVSGIVTGVRSAAPIPQPQRTVFSDAEYYICEQEFGTHTSIENYQYQPLRSSHCSPLPAPTPLRHKAQIATHLEQHSYSAPRAFNRRSHRRSQSDFGAFRLTTPPAPHVSEQSRHLSPLASYAAVREKHAGHARRQSSPPVTLRPKMYSSGGIAGGSGDIAMKQNALLSPTVEFPREPKEEAKL